jgi:hypothetical protein
MVLELISQAPNHGAQSRAGLVGLNRLQLVLHSSLPLPLVNGRIKLKEVPLR